MQEIIYVFGHRNPDTDSICSAIAYAEFKAKMGFNAQPFRLGELNRETEYVLKYFDLPVPRLLETVQTQVADLNMDRINPASPEISIKMAWSLMKKHNYKVLPVVDDEQHLLGLVTLSDITNKYMDTLENNIIASAKTPLGNILETINATLVCGGADQFDTTGKVVVAAMQPDELEPYIEKGDIVITGNRSDNQLRAMELGANCLVLTCGCRVDPAVIARAGEQGCIVMTTPMATFDVARLINQSVPVSYSMTTQNLVSFHINYFVDEIKERMLETRFRSYPVVDDADRIQGFISRYHLISQRRKSVILLDHNERSQTVAGVDQAEILEIIDHHRVGDIQTGNPIYVSNEPVGSTATIIANKYFDGGIRPSRKIAGILCAAIISDTLKFKSPTSTHLDRLTAVKLAEIAAINLEEFAALMFKKGTSLEGKTVHQLLYQDFKYYQLGNYKIGIGQINTTDTESIQELRDDLVAYMKHICQESEYQLLLLLVTDIINEASEAFFAGKDKMLLAKAFGVELGENSVFLPGVVSRKKQVVPNLAHAALL
ncbi:MAG: putative manganese-dependent inorganic diphosphatase [Bacillota bacterium]|jgi:manganese-dependent inorganic pyrophosphatase